MPISRIAATAAVVGALAVAGCGSSSSSGGSGSNTGGHGSAAGSSGATVKPRTIALIDFGASSPVDAATDSVVRGAASKLGWTIKFTDAGGDPQKANTAATAAVTQNVDAIVLVAGVSSYIKGGIAQAKAKKIPVVQVTAGPKDSTFTAQYVEDEQSLSHALSAYMAKTDPHAKVAALTASIVPAGKIRFDDMKRTIASTGGSVIASQEPNFSDPNAPQKVVTDMLTANPQTTAVWAVFDNQVTGAATAIRSRHSTAKLYSFYASPANLGFLRKPGNPLAAIADNSAPTTGAIAMDQLLYHFQKGVPLSSSAMAQHQLKETVYTRKNAPKSAWSATKILSPFVTKWTRDFPGTVK